MGCKLTPVLLCSFCSRHFARHFAPHFWQVAKGAGAATVKGSDDEWKAGEVGGVNAHGLGFQ